MTFDDLPTGGGDFGPADVSRETELKPVDVSRETSDEAPYGYTASGRPRIKPGPRKGLNVETTTRIKAPKRSRKPAVKAHAAPGDVDLRMVGATALIGIPATILSVAGTVAALQAGRLDPDSEEYRQHVTRSTALTVDAATLSLYTEPLAAGLVSLADSVTVLDSILTRMGTAGLGAGFLGAAIPLLLQLLANHGVIPAGVELPGLVKVMTKQEVVEAARKAAEG